MRRFAALAAWLLGACAASAPALVPSPEVDDPAARAERVAPALDGYRAAYVLSWNGARVGEARERLYSVEHGGPWRFERNERVLVKRGGARTEIQTTISIDVDESLSPRHVLVDRRVGPVRTRGEATRLPDDGWRVTYGDGQARLVDGTAMPSTLVPLAIAAFGVSPGRAYQGLVLVEGSGLAVARLTVDISGDRRVADATLKTAAGDLRARAELDRRGYLAAAGAADGVSSRRVTEAELAAPFDPPEVVDQAAVAVADATPGGSPDGETFRLRISGVNAPAPSVPEVPGQSIGVSDGQAWQVRVEPTPVPEGGFAEVASLTHHVARTLKDDLGTFALSAQEALAAGRGDCTAHSVVLADLLGRAGYETRLVTGYVFEDGALRRHRWVLVQVARRWIPVDPTMDQAPASPARVTLAVHRGTPDELAFIDDLAFAGWGAARASREP